MRENTQPLYRSRIVVVARLVLWSGVLPRFSLFVIALAGLFVAASPADEVVRIMAANISSGNNQSYDPGHGNRIFQGLDPDIVLVQEMNVGDNSAGDYRDWVDDNFSPAFSYFCESGKNIPNGIVSRYPILSSGVWEDAELGDREFVWARIDLPGDTHLWAISVHLKASSDSASRRNNQAIALRNYIQSQVPAGDHVVIGGDFNTYSRTESCVNTLSSVVVTAAPWPVDQDGNGNTNSGQSSPYDWVMPGGTLAARATPLVIGSNTFANGLVFDSRDYSPIAEVAPILSADSGATGMQHMAVVRAFLIPTNEAPVITQGTSVAVTLSKNNTPTAFTRSLNATDTDGDPLTWSIATPAAHGTAGIVAPASGGGVALSHVPVTHYTGTDSFVVQVSDGRGGSDTITVNLIIEEPPNVFPVITQGSTVAVTLSQNGYPGAFSRELSATDPDSDPLAWSVISPASHGSASVVSPATGGVVALDYQPAAGYTGSDAFTVQVFDGRGGTDEVIVQVTVEAAPAYDTWTFDRFAQLSEETEATLWGEDADPDDDGYSNLEEFAHGLDPSLPDAAPNLLAISSATVAGESFHVLSYKIRMDGTSPALSYTVETSNDPATGWTTLPAEEYTVTGESDLGGGFKQRTLELTGANPPGARFFRLSFAR